MGFDDLPLLPPMLAAITARGFTEPTPVQRAVLEQSVAAHDLLVSARTGSGKTVAFGLAVAPQLCLPDGTLDDPEAPKLLVVAPTRELAVQVQTELAWLYAPLNGRVISCVGGTDLRKDARALSFGTHIVVGTPGRLCDHVARKRLDLSELTAIVIDEADEMLDLGFREELETLLQAAPKARRTLLFSATIPAPIAELARRYQKDAVRVVAGEAGEAHLDIEYRAHAINPREREHAVVNVLRASDSHRALVFCATREGVTHLTASLLERGFQAVAMSGEMAQPERTRALQALRDGRARVLVATDVAARGIDLPDVGLVIHADLPFDAQVLQHRSGRTGRAGRKGVAVLLAPKGRRAVAERMLRGAKVKPVFTAVPTADEIRALDRDRLAKELVALSAEPSPEDLELAQTLLKDHPAEKLVAALVRARRGALPAPEELLDSANVPVRAERYMAADRPRPLPPVKGLRPRPTGDLVWFQVNVGRQGNADPRWLVPLICRRGNVTKEAIGRIRIDDRESRFEILAPMAAAFEAAAQGADSTDPNLRITRADGPGNATPRPAMRNDDDRPAPAGKPFRPASRGEDRPAPAGKTFRPAPRDDDRPAPTGKPFRPAPAGKTFRPAPRDDDRPAPAGKTFRAAPAGKTFRPAPRDDDRPAPAGKTFRPAPAGKPFRPAPAGKPFRPAPRDDHAPRPYRTGVVTDDGRPPEQTRLPPMGATPRPPPGKKPYRPAKKPYGKR